MSRVVSISAYRAPSSLTPMLYALSALDPNNPRTIGEAGYVLAAAGQPDEARKLLVTLKSMVRRGTALPTFVAMIQMGLGQRDEALDSLAETSGPKVGAGLQGLDQWHILINSMTIRATRSSWPKRGNENFPALAMIRGEI